MSNNKFSELKTNEMSPSKYKKLNNKTKFKDQNTQSNMSWHVAEALGESANSSNISNFGTADDSDDLIVAVFK